MRTPQRPQRFWVKSSLISLLVLSLLALATGAIRVFDRPAEAAGATPPPQAGKKAAQETKAAPAASAALDKLRRASGAEIRAHVARETGHYDFVRAAGGGVLAPAHAGSSPEERAAAFLREHGALVGLGDAERQALGGPASPLKTARVVEDAVGGQHVRLGQTYRGLPVFGAQVVVHLNARGVTAVNGHFVPGLRLDTRPAVKQAAAEAAAVRERFGSAPLSVVKTELAIYRVGLLEGFEGPSVLAYAVEVTDGGATRAQVWVDALKGTILNRISLNHKALDRVIYTPIFSPVTAVRREGDPYTPGLPPGTTGADPINNLYLFAGETYNLWMSGFGRDSYDGAGHTMHSVYLVNQVCPNAYWNSVSTNYCPDFDSDDVVSHEWGHAYTEYTHGLIYAYQSGALNESYSDIFGESHDLLNTTDAEGGNNNAQPLPDGQRWQMGEDVPTLNAEALGILRDMWDPTRYGDPDKVSSPNYACGSDDGGGVHTNSGVPNHAFAMLVDGKTYNGVTVQGIGFNRALAIYYRAMTVYQTPTTNFVQHADAL
ncbi:MAG TPA: M4 family metallopeptidase, partial [Pyrinomonadaceae bacterium]